MTRPISHWRKTKTVGIRLPVAVWRRLKLLAKRRGKFVSVTATEALEEFCEREEQQK